MHEYLSTSCFHDFHKYCKSKAGTDGVNFWNKNPASCKFCEAPCICWCHKEEND